MLFWFCAALAVPRPLSSIPEVEMGQHVTVGEVSLHHFTQGEGRPLLLVHGFPLEHHMWTGQIGPLSQHCRVIAPDLRGFGRSTVTAGTVTMEQHADDLAGLLDAMGVREPVVFCGLSMGGYVAWQFWKKHRERLAGLVLCDTKAGGDDEAGKQNRRAVADQVLLQGSSTLVGAMIGKLLSQESRANAAKVEPLVQMIEAAPAQGVAAAALGMAERPDVTGMLGEINVPALVICGEEDAICPPDQMKAMAEAMPRAEFVLVPGAGHMAPFEKPEEVNTAIVRFLGALGE